MAELERSNGNLPEADPEINAISTVCACLQSLDENAKARVLTYAIAKFDIKLRGLHEETTIKTQRAEEPFREARIPDREDDETAAEDDNDGISSTAKKWLRRNGLSADKLSSIFSLGVDEIDLVAKTVPGKSKKERMQKVFLLKGVANYLGSGAARFTYEQVKEALVHYDAFDSSHFADFFKSLAADVSGSKENGYTLTSRGLTNATALLKEMAP